MAYLIKFECSSFRQIGILLDVFSDLSDPFGLSLYNINVSSFSDFYCGGLCVTCSNSSNFEIFFNFICNRVRDRMISQFDEHFWMLKFEMSYCDIKGLVG